MEASAALKAREEDSATIINALREEVKALTSKAEVDAAKLDKLQEVAK